MSARPAGYSSEEDFSDDDFGEFSIDSDMKAEKNRREELALKHCKQQRELDNKPEIRVFNAVTSGDIDTIKKELDNGLDINKKIQEDYTPLFLAACYGNARVLKLLLDRGADPTVKRDSVTALMACVESSKSGTSLENILDCIEALLEYRIDVKWCDRKRRTALMLACQQGFPEVVKLLLPLSRLDGEDNEGRTALFYAVNSNQPEIVKVLIEAGADTTHNDMRLNDAKYYASINDYTEILQLFPSEEVELSADDLMNKNIPLEPMFEDLQKFERPPFLNDVALMLYGMQCDALISVFQEKGVGLETFLCLDEDELRDIGVKLSFQRERVLRGLYKFHQQPFRQRTVPNLTTDEEFSTYDILVTVTSLVRQITVEEAFIKYLRKNMNSEEFKEPINETLRNILNKYESIKYVTSVLHNQALKFDRAVPNQPDLIKKNSKLCKTCFKLLILKYVTIFGISAASLVYFIRCVR